MNALVNYMIMFSLCKNWMEYSEASVHYRFLKVFYAVLLCNSYISSMIGTGEWLSSGNSVDSVSAVLTEVSVWAPLQHLHQVGDEEITLKCRYTLLRQDGGLTAHGARQSQTVGGNVVLQTPGETGTGY